MVFIILYSLYNATDVLLLSFDNTINENMDRNILRYTWMNISHSSSPSLGAFRCMLRLLSCWRSHELQLRLDL